MRNTSQLEKTIEERVITYAKSKGILCYKFTSPNRRSVPDRMLIMPDGKGIFFIEFKRQGQKPTPAQALEIEKIRKQGAAVFVVDNIALGESAVNQMLIF